MHIKRMHEMIEKLTDCTKSAIENDADKIGNFYIPDVVDMIKDLNEASYYASIVKAMEEAKKEDEEEEKYMMKRFKEEYGEEDGEKRYYDEWRYKTTGRYAPKGKGTRVGRRGYVEPPYYHMMPEMYDDYNAEEMRDIDRHKGRMYFSQPMNGNTGGSSSNTSGGNMGGSSRGYSDGYNDGNRRGYEEGYERGKDDGRRSGNNSQSRSDRMRRNYTENKHMNDNSPEGKKKNMENLDSYMKELAGEMTELVEDMDASEKNMVRSKLQTLASKIQ